MTEIEYENEKNTGSSTGSQGAETVGVLSAIKRRDWSCLRSLSVRPGGFGEDRKYAWPFLLHAENGDDAVKEEDETDSISSPIRRRRGRRSSLRASDSKLGVEKREKDTSRSISVDSHPDERQIKLDTDRSFVLYGVDDRQNVEAVQERLNSLITSVFRRYPQLSYFQGYHDIISVLFLTLSEENQVACAEKMSLHRLRDAMGKGLEPLLGLLHILKYLLRLADAEYAALLERNTPLPYFALSNLLTLFSHDVPTLPSIQHVFDFLLSRPPIAVVYLVASITLEHRDEAFRMEREGEEGMLHSLLTSLPQLADGDMSGVPQENGRDSDVHHEELVNSIFAKGEFEEPQQIVQAETGSNGDSPEESDLGPKTTESSGGRKFLESGANQNDEASTSYGILPEASKGTESVEIPERITTNSESSLDVHSTTVQGSSNVSDLSTSDLRSSESSVTEISSRPPSPRNHLSSDHAPRKIVSLHSLLEHADALFEQFPLSTPALHVSEIMGPRSVIFTWSEDPHGLMSDAEAEAVTAQPEFIILPFVDPDEARAAKEAEEAAKEGRPGRTHRRRTRRKHFGVRLDKKTVFTATVVTLSVAVAVYSMRSKGNGGVGGGGGGGGVFDVSRSDKTLRKAARVVSGILIGGSERLLETFGW